VAGRLRRVEQEQSRVLVTVDLPGGATLEARAGSSCARLGHGDPRPGDEVALLGTRQEVFDDRTGGPREAPAHRAVFALEALAAGDDAAALMVAELQARGLQPPQGDPSLPTLPWPEGVIVVPAAGDGPVGITFHLRPAAMDWLPLSLLLPAAFFGLLAWNMWPATRVFIFAAVLGATALAMALLSLRHRMVLLGPQRLRLQYGHLPWPARTLARTDEIEAVYVAREDGSLGVRVAAGGEQDPWLLSPGQAPSRAALVAALLERALGIAPDRDRRPGEESPDLPGRLPDLDAVMRPPPAPGDPAAEQGPRSRMRVADLGRPAPRGVRATRRGKVLTISTPDSGVSLRLIFVVGPCVLWLMFNHERLFEGPLLLLPDLGACAGVLLGIYSVVAGLANRTTITVSPSTFIMTRGPVPWPGRVACHRSVVAGFEEDSEMVGKGGVIYHLDLVLRGGQRRRVVPSSGSEERIWWLKRALEQELGLGG